MDKKNRSSVIQIRVFDNAKDLYEKAAEKDGMTLSAWCRKVLADHARSKGLVRDKA